MESFLHFLKTYEVWIYLVAGVVGLVYVQKLLKAWREWRSALFGLEKENAQRSLSAAVAVLSLIFILAAGEFILVSFVMPAFPSTAMVLTPTLDLLATPTITLQSGSPTGGANPPTATPLAAAGTGCVTGQIEWNAPEPQAQISGAVEMFATINLPDLGYYKYEYNQAGSDTWTTLAGGNVLEGKVWTDEELRNNFQLDDTGVALYQQAEAQGRKACVLAFAEHAARYEGCRTLTLGRMDSPQTIAHALFAALRRMDDEGVQVILCEAVATEGIGLAIMNRMCRAAEFHVVQV